MRNFLGHWQGDQFYQLIISIIIKRRNVRVIRSILRRHNRLGVTEVYQWNNVVFCLGSNQACLSFLLASTVFLSFYLFLILLNQPGSVAVGPEPLFGGFPLWI
jgi:hypothetical protein